MEIRDTTKRITLTVLGIKEEEETQVKGLLSILPSNIARAVVVQTCGPSQQMFDLT